MPAAIGEDQAGRRRGVTAQAEESAEHRAVLQRLLAGHCSGLGSQLEQVWPDPARMEGVLCQALASFTYCQALYAMDASGRQMSATLTREDLDRAGLARGLEARRVDRPERPAAQLAREAVFAPDEAERADHGPEDTGAARGKPG